MSKSPLDPGNSGIGDLGTAMFQVDARLRQLHDDPAVHDEQYQAQLREAFETADLDQVIEGFCSLVYLLMRWLTETYEAAGQDAAMEVVPYTTRCLSTMKRHVEPEAVPTMGA